MIVRHHIADMTSADVKNKASALVYLPKDNRLWFVLESTLHDAKIEWSHVAQGDGVPVQLAPYLIPAGPSEAVAAVAMLGALAVANAPQSFRELHVVVGEPIENVAEGTLRLWLGFAGVQ